MSRRKARNNPIGTALPPGARPIRVGRGTFVHCANPSGGPLCGSGRGHAGPRPSKASYITCYRCEKLMRMNIADGRAACDPGGRR